jgi:adenylate cyclase
MVATAQQRYFVRLFFSILPISIAVSAAFSYFQGVAAGSDGVSASLFGAVAGGLIPGAILLLEVFVLSGGRSTLSRNVPFLVLLAVRSLTYLAVIWLGLAVGAWLVPSAGAGSVFFQRSGLLFSLAMSLGFNLLVAVNRLLGQRVLLNFAAGRYRRPRIEERVLLFIDMESSTAIAERLGEAGFFVFLNQFIGDITDPIVAQRGEIHKYIGDELIVTWTLAAGLAEARCIRACFDALQRLDTRAAEYQSKFGQRANFRAGLHCGPVVIGELGLVKLEIALLGDTMNTTARVEQACRDTGHRVLASGALIARIAALPPGIVKRSLGPMRLRGKEAELELYALEAATETRQTPTIAEFSPPQLAPMPKSNRLG